MQAEETRDNEVSVTSIRDVMYHVLVTTLAW